MSTADKFVDGIALIPVSADPPSPVEGQLQRSDGTARAVGLWEYKSGAWVQLASASIPITVVSKSGAATLAASGEEVVKADASGGGFSLTLPAASGNNGLIYRIIKTDSSANAVTIDGNGSETINGATTTTLNTQYEELEIVCDGSNWVILNRKSGTKWTSYTPSTNGLGTPTSVDFQWRREGTMMHVRGELTTGTNTAVEARINLPGTYTVSTDNPANSVCVGTLGKAYSSAALHFVLAYSGIGYVRIGKYLSSGTNNISAVNGNDLASTSRITVDFMVPINGWKGDDE